VEVAVVRVKGFALNGNIFGVQEGTELIFAMIFQFFEPFPETELFRLDD
jgi:hypothetical protein